MGTRFALIVALLAACGGSETPVESCAPDCTPECVDPIADCAAAPACQIATCTADQTCATTADASKNGTSCGSALVCSNGACVPVPATCGNGAIDGTEACDFGAANGSGTGCEVDCRFSCTMVSGACDDSDPCNGVEMCGAVTVAGQGGQKCVAGTALANATSCGTGKICVNAACTTAVCGDGFTTGTEECDDADQMDGDGCDNDCTFSCVSTDATRNCTPTDACAGQGTCNNTTHTCTPGTPLTNGASCGSGGYCATGVCTQPTCGNGNLEPGETCDNGGLNGTVGSGCKADCTYVCVNPAADCGAAPTCQRWTCSASNTCLAVADSAQNGMTCGTNLVCSAGSCASASAICGNSITELGEQCDFGSGNGPGTGCETNCTFSCTTAPNSCDDGNLCDGAETCGTVTVSGRTGQRCTAGTPLGNGASCGAGRICSAQVCTLSTCGDGFIDGSAGESCEPPNTATCDVACRTLQCGDGIRAGAEQCDDGGTLNLDGCDASCRFEQSHRMTSLAISFTTSTYCPVNALGTALTGSVARNDLTTALTAGIADGSITAIFHALGLDDLTGTTDPSLSLGVLGANPQTGTTTYNGANDLDWWHTTDAASINAARTPTTLMPASIAAKVLNAGPADFAIDVNFAGTPVRMDTLAGKIRGTIGATSTPLTSTTTTPGHLASENLDPALMSYATMTGAQMCGNTTAQSLASVVAPAVIIGCGFGKCTQCYTTANTLLDVVVSGCDVLLVGQQVRATQPDTSRVPGNVFRFTANAQRIVTSCTKNNVATTLQDCFANAAYSTLYNFTTGRVIAK